MPPYRSFSEYTAYKLRTRFLFLPFILNMRAASPSVDYILDRISFELVSIITFWLAYWLEVIVMCRASCSRFCSSSRPTITTSNRFCSCLQVDVLSAAFGTCSCVVVSHKFCYGQCGHKILNNNERSEWSLKRPKTPSKCMRTLNI